MGITCSTCGKSYTDEEITAIIGKYAAASLKKGASILSLLSYISSLKLGTGEPIIKSNALKAKLYNIRCPKCGSVSKWEDTEV